MDVQLTEALAERLVLVQRHALVAEEDDLMAQQRSVDRSEGALIEGLGHVHPFDLGADDRGQRPFSNHVVALCFWTYAHTFSCPFRVRAPMFYLPPLEAAFARASSSSSLAPRRMLPMA